VITHELYICHVSKNKIMTPSLQKIAAFLQSKNLDYFLIKNKENIVWLTEFESSNALVLVSKLGKVILSTDSRYRELAELICHKKKFDFVLMDADFTKKFAPTIKGSIAVEKSLTLASFSAIRKSFKNAAFVSYDQVIKKIRAEKTASEIMHTRAAAVHTSKVLAEFMQWIKTQPGLTESQAAFELEHRLRGGGKYGIAFDSIVAFGSNSAIPHHAPGDRRLQPNENILIDCGATYRGYHADITRNSWNGDRVDPEYLEKYKLLFGAQQNALKQITAGQNIQQLCQSVRAELGDEAKFFTHSLGHGTGLEIHELPNLSVRVAKKITLKKNQIVTCEPGLYYSGLFGIRIEDQVIVGDVSSEIISDCLKLAP
jgi:Xaa-Pro aminopeptidase